MQRLSQEIKFSVQLFNAVVIDSYKVIVIIQKRNEKLNLPFNFVFKDVAQSFDETSSHGRLVTATRKLVFKNCKCSYV